MTEAISKHLLSLSFRAKRIADGQPVNINVIRTPYSPILHNAIFDQGSSVQKLPSAAPYDNKQLHIAIDETASVQGYISTDTHWNTPGEHGIYIHNIMTARFKQHPSALARIGWILFASACQLYLELGNPSISNPMAVGIFPIKQAKDIIAKMHSDQIIPGGFRWHGKFVEISTDEVTQLLTAVKAEKHLGF